MTRVPDWPERLVSFINERRNLPFVWGQNDCALFAADLIGEITGVDLAADVRGYSSEREAARIIRDAGGMRGLVSLPEKHPGLAQRGDAVLALIEGRETFGICVGTQYIAPGMDGLVFRPMSEAMVVFEV